MKPKKLVVTLAIAVVTLFTSCAKDDFQETIGICPKVISTNPVNSSIGVPLNQVITVNFNEPINPATITASTFKIASVATLILPSVSIFGAITYSGTTATFTPTTNLIPNTTYFGTVTTAVKDLSVNALQEDYVWTFSTGAVLQPIVISTTPTTNESSVVLNKVIRVTFNMPMDFSTLNTTTFTLKQGTTVIAGVVSNSGNDTFFTPNINLTGNTIYTATITTGAQSTTAVAIATDYVWNFTTVNSSIAPNLGSIAPFGAFGGNAGVTNQGINTVVNGSIGTTAASTLITGFHDASSIYTETPLNVGNVTNGIFTAPPIPGTAASFAIATQGLVDANAAYSSISPASMPGGIDPGAGELGGLTLAPGIYKSASGTFNISNGNLTLDAQGNPNATRIFQTAAGLTVGISGPTGAKSVLLINGALPKNVFWYVGSAATINGAGGGTMVGTIIANSGVTFSTSGNTVQTILNGRAISLVASVTMVNTTITIPQ